MLKKALLLTLILPSLSSCSLFIDPMPASWNWGIKPRPLTGVKNFPPADTEYGKGFRDGCASGWDATGKGLISDFNYKRYDYQRMKQSTDYNTGWWEGFEQCTYILDHEVV
jgi:hypothetical protein